MKIGFDADTSKLAVCTSKQWENKTVSILLFGFGTIPNANSICLNAKEEMLSITKKLLQTQFEKMVHDNGASDMNYVAIHLYDVLNICNTRIRETAAYLGEGIYIGGAIAYTVDDSFLILGFGGGIIYEWDGIQIKVLANSISYKHLLQDALGCTPNWKGNFQTGTFQSGSKLLLFSGYIDPDTCISQMGMLLSAYENTLAMSLRRELDNKGISPSAVIDIDYQ